MSWENPTFADLLTICAHASIVAPIKQKNEAGEVEIIGYQSAPSNRHRTLAVAMLTREMIARVVQHPHYGHGMTQKLDHFCWAYASETNSVDVAAALASPFLPIAGSSTAGPRAAGLFSIWGVTNRNFAQMYEHGGPFVPTLMPVAEMLSLTPQLKSEVTALHAANHDADPEIDAVADAIDSAYAAARPAFVAQLQQSFPSRGFA
jgi:hypothetical protein